MVGGDDRPEGLRLVAERVDFLDRLREGALRKRDLVDELDYSRSTVNRALEDLETAGLVAERDARFETTLAGRLALSEHRAYVATGGAVLDAESVLAPLPADAPLAPEFLVGADLELASEPTPFSVLEPVEAAIREADRVRLLLPLLEAPGRLRACYDLAVEGSGEVELVVDEALAAELRAQFAGTLRELAGTGRFAARQGSTPPFALQLTDHDGTTTASVTVYRDGGAVHGVVTNDEPAAVEWAERCYRRRRADATDVTDQFRSLTGTGDGDRGTRERSDGAAAATLPRPLEREGFRRLDALLAGGREPAPPATCLRAGLDVVEVAAGYAVERERPDEDRPAVAAELLEGLRSGTDHALVGPPGSGKSTVCKQVACRWHEAGDPVLYRESGAPTVESVADLAATLRELDGPALVVVEDAVRPEASAVFEAMAAFRGDDSVAFLLDARREEWEDPEEFPADARLRRYKSEAVETVEAPPLDERECRRFVEHVAEALDADVDVAPDRLVEEFGGDDGEPTPSGVLLLLHRLTGYADPLGPYDGDAPTTLTEEVRRTRAALGERGDLPLDVGVAVTLLNAAGVEVRPELVHALAETEADHDVVAETLAFLEGRMLFGTGPDGRLRTVHEAWSTEFLAELLEGRGERETHRRVGRCVTRILALADDPARREAIEWELAGDAPALREVEADPRGWADGTVRKLFALGRDYPGLAPLFGTTEYSRIDLPEACSPGVRARCAHVRGRMYLTAGDLETARREFDCGRAFARSAPEDEATAVQAECLSGLATLANRRGTLDAAEDRAREALAIYRDLDHDRGVAFVHNDLAGVAWRRGDHEAAREHAERALELYRELDYRRRISDCLGNLAVFARAQGDIDAAEAYAEEAVEISREVGYDRRRAQALATLGGVAVSRADYETAEDFRRRALELRRELGIPHEEAMSLNNLGQLERARGNLAAAERYYERSLALKREVGERRAIANGRRNLAVVARKRGEYDEAERLATDALETYREIEDRDGEADARKALGTLALDRGDLEAAGEHLRAAHELNREAGTREDVARVRSWLARLALARGDYDAARDHAEASLETYRGLDNDDGEGVVLRILGRAALAAGDPDEAGDRLAASRTLLEAVGNRLELAATREALAALARERDDPESARDHLEAAARTYRECGAHRDALDAYERLVARCEALGDHDRAVEHCRIAAELADESGLDERGEQFRDRRRSLDGEGTAA